MTNLNSVQIKSDLKRIINLESINDTERASIIAVGILFIIERLEEPQK